MNRYFFVLATVIIFSMGLVLMSCGDDQYRHHPLMQDNGDISAKDMTEGMSCDVDDVVVEDCLDSCTCCYFGQPENTEDCVEDCDGLLMMAYVDHEPTKANYVLFKECITGCVSLCGQRENDLTCWNECRHYLGL